MPEPDDPPKFMTDPYLDWSKREGVPIYEDFGLDLLHLETRPWPRFGAKGAIVHVRGRGDFLTLFLLELPPGTHTSPQHHLFEEAILVVSGHGSTTLRDHTGRNHSFERGTEQHLRAAAQCREPLFQRLRPRIGAPRRRLQHAGRL